MSKSLRQIALEMDPLADKKSAVQLSSVLKQHRWPAGSPASTRGLKEVVRRHSDSASIKFLSYNTYLTQAHITLPDPFPDVKLTAKPALHGRAREIGQRIMAEYDFACLYEVMQEQQRDEILAAWGPSPPDNFFGGTLSSLFTISQKFKIGRREQHTYATKGKVKSVDVIPKIGPSVDISLDSDFYAEKGVMLTEIITPFGTVEVYSTHLMFGGGFDQTGEDLINAATPFEKHISPSSPSERFDLQMNQIDELIGFYKEHHNQPNNQHNVAIICGDFNIDGSNVNHFGELKRRLAAIGMKDVWADGPFPNDMAGGQTCRNDDDDTKTEERNFDNVCTPLATNGEYCDDSRKPNHPPPPDCVGRFDYIFVEEPQPGTFNLDLTRVRRRQFRWGQPSEGQFFLSDHLGLETTLVVSRSVRS
jgi:endonuclease/exonuclease/phosphatase family metal-dependent hydrolase